MKLLSKNIKSSFTIKKSKFICFGLIVHSKEEVSSIIKSFKSDYPDASHVCYAYILDDNTYYFTDAGEPSGTAGAPIYNVLKHKGINFCLFIVIRYFGGIKFGLGPLKQTYKNVTIDTLDGASLRECSIKDVILIQIPYNLLKNTTSQFRNEIINKKYEKEFVEISLAGDKNIILKKLRNSKIEPISIKEKQVV